MTPSGDGNASENILKLTRAIQLVRGVRRASAAALRGSVDQLEVLGASLARAASAPECNEGTRDPTAKAAMGLEIVNTPFVRPWTTCAKSVCWAPRLLAPENMRSARH